MKIQTIRNTDDSYPELLGEIAQPPKQLYVLGALREDMPLVAIVGSRKVTNYGLEATRRLSYDLARMGVGIVSGLAYGVDAAAHRAALDANGYTIAVMAGGLDKIHPARNRQLALDVLSSHGALISENKEGVPSLKQHFPARNRIVAGLCAGTIVTEAAERSGALITAGFALESNREVMAVPGNITNPLSQGTNNLIKAGATPVANAEDVLTAMGMEHVETIPGEERADQAAGNEEEFVILELLHSGINNTDELILRTGWDAATFNQTVASLEITGRIKRVGGESWTLL